MGKGWWWRRGLAVNHGSGFKRREKRYGDEN